MPVFRHGDAASRFLAVSTDYLFTRRRATDRPLPPPADADAHWLPRPSPRPAPVPAAPRARSHDLAEAAGA